MAKLNERSKEIMENVHGFTEQELCCLRGLHEPDYMRGTLDGQIPVKICKHCHAVYCEI